MGYRGQMVESGKQLSARRARGLLLVSRSFRIRIMEDGDSKSQYARFFSRPPVHEAGRL